MKFLNRLASRFPPEIQFELKHHYYRLQIANQTFLTDEPEYALLETLIQPGDWVVDVGANVGHYTNRFSTLVGKNGRVIAIEPAPHTFALLASNVMAFKNKNVTLLNVALSNEMRNKSLIIPYDENNNPNYYRAQIIDVTSQSSLNVLTLRWNDLNINHKVSLVKIDVEGHEESVLLGMENLLSKDHPILIIETESQSVMENLAKYGYSAQRLSNSPNVIFKK
jgi:FkbM family methyltransferase